MADLRGGRAGRARAAATAALLAVVLVACSSHGSSSGASSSTSTEVPPSTFGTPQTLVPGPSTTSPRRVVLRLAEPDVGRTVAIQPGNRLTVILHSTYWTITTPPDPKVLRLLGPATVTPALTCRPVGRGCGTLTVRYRAIHVGTTTIVAHRTTCGEALLCRPGQRDWLVRITVAR